jgi:hypothetical protein
MRSTGEIASELESFYRRYIEIFNRQDADQFVACFAHPYGVVSGGRGLQSIADEEKHRKSFLRSMTVLKHRGWARSVVDSFKGWAFAPDLAMIVSDVTRYKTDESVLERVRACYMLHRHNGAWKIVTLTEIKPPFFGPGDIPYPTR